ncbi:hypothetical protein COW53_00385 [bacterium CG17_big_fil_post_rev_8_21_14_2_50_64_8]|nr:MAG: hypothetical protein COW53_00385 [bacterium CG17_big_fil_post_rev_8_21_14_2_50_64_8]
MAWGRGLLAAVLGLFLLAMAPMLAADLPRPTTDGCGGFGAAQAQGFCSAQGPSRALTPVTVTRVPAWRCFANIFDPSSPAVSACIGGWALSQTLFGYGIAEWAEMLFYVNCGALGLSIFVMVVFRSVSGEAEWFERALTMLVLIPITYTASTELNRLASWIDVALACSIVNFQFVDAAMLMGLALLVAFLIPLNLIALLRPSEAFRMAAQLVVKPVEGAVSFVTSALVRTFSRFTKT